MLQRMRPRITPFTVRVATPAKHSAPKKTEVSVQCCKLCCKERKYKHYTGVKSVRDVQAAINKLNNDSWLFGPRPDTLPVFMKYDQAALAVRP